MSEPEDEPSAKMDQALSENQRLEREEREADLRRQHESDQRMVDALARKDEDFD